MTNPLIFACKTCKAEPFEDCWGTQWNRRFPMAIFHASRIWEAQEFDEEADRATEAEMDAEIMLSKEER